MHLILQASLCVCVWLSIVCLRSSLPGHVLQVGLGKEFQGDVGGCLFVFCLVAATSLEPRLSRCL